MRKIFQRGTGKIVLGNEACDLDSMVSAVLLGMVRSYCPCFDCPRKEVRLRPEAVFAFDHYLGVDVEKDGVFFDEIDREKINEYILVDHNGRLGIENKVSEIWDHHVDEMVHDIKEKRIEMVGSCATLILEKYLDSFEKNVLELGLATILLDTVNLDPKFEKVTPKDVEVAEKIMQKLSMDKEKQNEMFNTLQNAKFDTSKLTAEELLRSDFKQWKMSSCNVGIAAVKENPISFFEKCSGDVFASFSKTNSLDLLVIMHAYTDQDETFRRDLGILVLNPQMVNQSNLTQYLLSTDLQLKKFEQSPISYYSQGNIGSSRKKVAPLLFQYFSQKP